ncbi:hypothetical protein JG688_00002194 [Phytophthora aleatoria]|uniref:FYVE-type domain-containing protein n=1 Tax=Phytophthora aleatoria TaxID=2496075 RepID=A0A8J5JFK0_9STRA|nr:hypothetical protein JG688_00002194 [Phytophthora aleatoria]
MKLRDLSGVRERSERRREGESQAGAKRKRPRVRRIDGRPVRIVALAKRHQARVEGSSSSKALLRHLVHVSGKGSLSHCATAPGGRGLHSDRVPSNSQQTRFKVRHTSSSFFMSKMSFRFPRWGRKKSKSKEPVGGNKYYPNGANDAGGVPRGPPSAPGRTYSNGSDYQSQQSWQSNGTMPPAPASADYQHSGQRAAAPSANRGAALPFSHPLYAMDAEGMIHLKATGKGLDDSDLAVHQDEIINTVVKYVQDSMRKELGFREVFIPASSTPEAPVKANVFVSRNYETCKKLLVFVAVSRGLYPGLWSRGLVLHAGVKSGSMLEYFRKAIDEGYGIIVANPNKNVIVMRDGKQRLQIPGSSSPEEHMDSLWDSYVARSAARRVYFLGYSYGGVLIKYLLQSRGDQLMRRNGAIALIESSHRIEDGDSQSVKSILAHRTMYWESNDQLFQTKLDGDAPHRTGCTCLSAGRPPRAHANHYYVTAFCINKIQDALFRFLDTRDATTYVAGEKPVPEPPASAPAFIGNGAGPTAPQLTRQESTRREANNSKMGNSEKHCNLCLFHFTLFDRRHHCRMCHRAVCNACSRDRLFLPGSSTAQRVCTECATEGPRANNQAPTQPKKKGKKSKTSELARGCMTQEGYELGVEANGGVSPPASELAILVLALRVA